MATVMQILKRLLPSEDSPGVVEYAVALVLAAVSYITYMGKWPMILERCQGSSFGAMFRHAGRILRDI